MINEKVAEAIKGHIKKAVEKSQEMGTDIMGFGAAFQKRLPEQWKKMQNNWSELYRELDVEIKVESIIRRFGLVKHPPFYEYHVPD